MLFLTLFIQTDYSKITDPKVIFEKTLVPPAVHEPHAYYVEADKGNDHNPGTKSQPFRSIRRAADLAEAGDTVYVGYGVYREQAEQGQAGVKPRHSGAPNAWIRFIGDPQAHPQIISPTWATFRLMDVAYIEVSGFDVSTERLQGQTDPSYDRNTGNGIDITRCHHILIKGNYVHDCGGGGIGSAYSDYMTIENNNVTRNAYYSIYDCSGISLWEGRDFDTKPGVHNIVRGNRSWHNENKGPTPLNEGKLTDGNGIIVDGSKGDGAFLIENNVCWDNGGRGIQVFNARNATVRNNTVAWNERTAPNDPSDLRAINFTNAVFENNIVVARPGQNFNDNWQATNVVYRHNLFFGYGKISDQVGKDNLVGIDPMFRKAKMGGLSTDFRLAAGSPAIGLGAQLH